MSEEPHCRQRLLAAGRSCRVTCCDCGTVQVVVGALILRLSERQLEQAAETLEAAATALRREGAAGSTLLC